MTEQVGPLAEELVAAGAMGRPVNVVALSLGTEVALLALDALADRSISLGGFLLLVGGTAGRDDRWSRAVLVPRMGVGNVYNPADLTLWAEKAASGRRVIGHRPLELRGVDSFRTGYGHFEQLDHLAEIVTAAPSAGAHPA